MFKGLSCVYRMTHNNFLTYVVLMGQWEYNTSCLTLMLVYFIYTYTLTLYIYYNIQNIVIRSSRVIISSLSRIILSLVLHCISICLVCAMTEGHFGSNINHSCIS